MSHQWKFLSSHGSDEPGKSLDTYSQCVWCGALKHDYAHGGGQTSPNYPRLYRLGAPINEMASCHVIVHVENRGSPSTSASEKKI